MVMSALHLKADVCGATRRVGFGPIADIPRSLDQFVWVRSKYAVFNATCLMSPK